MKIVIINGSPKGNEDSVTMIHVRYFQKQFQDYNYVIFPVSRRIKSVENDIEYFNSIMAEIEKADAVIWAFPVYFFVVPGQFKRFVELIFERKKQNVFKNKYATSIITSARVFDYIAENYIHAISEDTGMSYVKGFLFETAIENDLLQKKHQKAFKQFGKSFFDTIAAKKIIYKRFISQTKRIQTYSPKLTKKSNDEEAEQKIVIITDHKEGSNLHQMVKLLKNEIKNKITIIDIENCKINPCIGCIKCFFTGKCFQTDDFKNLFYDNVFGADVIIYAITIKDRFISSKMKMFIDREIIKGWCDLFKNKRIGFLISGPLRQNENIYHFLQVFASYQSMELLGVISDENDDENQTTQLIVDFAKKIEDSFTNDRIIHENFFRKAFQTLTRDILYVFAASHPVDYKYYKKNKLFDFANKNFGYRLKRFFFNSIFSIPKTINILIKIGSLCLLVPYKQFIKKNDL